MPLAIITDFGGGGQVASLTVYNRGDGDKGLRTGALTLVDIRIQFSKVVVFVGYDVAINASRSYRGGNIGNGPG